MSTVPFYYLNLFKRSERMKEVFSEERFKEYYKSKYSIITSIQLAILLLLLIFILAFMLRVFGVDMAVTQNDFLTLLKVSIVILIPLSIYYNLNLKRNYKKHCKDILSYDQGRLSYTSTYKGKVTTYVVEVVNGIRVKDSTCTITGDIKVIRDAKGSVKENYNHKLVIPNIFTNLENILNLMVKDLNSQG